MRKPSTTMAAKTLKLAAQSTEIESDDLLIEILRRLPIRSLIRFELVSKHWESLITSPRFCSLVHYRSPKPAAGLFVPWSYNDHKTRPGPVERLPFSVGNPKSIPPLKLKIKLVQSCNGLLLGSINSRYYVYNPTTNKSLTLPPLDPELKAGTKTRSTSLAFDPNKSPYYKVICVLELSESVSHIHVYSSETRIWTSNGRPYNRGVNLGGVYWNGCINWFYAGSYFNIENQTLEKLPRPPDTAWKFNYYFGESCGHLYYTRICRAENMPDRIIVWELLRDYTGWVFKYSVDVDFWPSYGSWRNYNDAISVLSVVCGEKEDDSFLVIEIDPGEAVRYNLVSKTCETLRDFRGRYCHRAFQYIESLGCV